MRTTLLLLLTAGFTFAQNPVTVVKRPAPDKALIFEGTVPASPEAVWLAFSTSAGLSTWLTPGAVVDLRKGGEWTAHFPGGSTGGGTILEFTPGKEIVLAAMAPDKFPTVRAQRTRADFVLIPKGTDTLVRLTQTGWKEGAEWDQAYDYLASGNVQLLETLVRRFAKGPIDWAKEWGIPVAGVHDFILDALNGTPTALASFKGKVMLLVNVASQCGFTPQYEGLQALYVKYRDRGLVIAGFPANNFGQQEPGTNEEIGAFCRSKYGVTFPMFAKISVAGEDKAPLYRYLTDKAANPKTGGEIQWNFTKFLVDRNGRVIQRFESEVEPDSSEIVAAIEAALK
jgi:glutathione peroxidase